MCQPTEPVRARPPPSVHLGVGQPAGDQEADRAEDVGRPDQVLVVLDRQVGPGRRERADVESNVPTSWIERRPAVDPARLPADERAPTPSTSARELREHVVGRVHRLAELQVRGRREEDRPDGERRRRRSPGRAFVEVRAGSNRGRSRASRRRTARPSTSSTAGWRAPTAACGCRAGWWRWPGRRAACGAGATSTRPRSRPGGAAPRA